MLYLFYVKFTYIIIAYVYCIMKQQYETVLF